ncbi:MAG: 6-phosphogluconolactonase [Thiotrichales bacterium]|nr:6-phosphogluconolactonase [Thiotrichales bacterium]
MAQCSLLWHGDCPKEAWWLFESGEALELSALKTLLDTAEQAIRLRGAFHCVLAGGTTPLAIYQRLANVSCGQANFERWFLYLGDERVYPSGHPQRNQQMIEDAWLRKEQVPKTQIFWMKTELGLEAAASDYAEKIAGVTFDLVLLGMGEDGHTASLFPNHALIEQQGLILETAAPKAPQQRLSLSYETLNRAENVMILVTGSAKQQALQQWYHCQKEAQPCALPVSQIHGQEQTWVLLDLAAFSG